MKRCPHCNEPFEQTEHVNGSHNDMRFGDITICAGCLNVLVYQPDSTFRVVKRDEIKEFPTTEQSRLLEALTVAAKLEGKGIPKKEKNGLAFNIK